MPQTEWSPLPGDAPGRTERRVASHAAATPNAPALVTESRTITWSQLDSLANGLAAAFAEQGLAKGNRVGWLGRNCAEFPILLVACRRAGLVLTALNWRLTPEDLSSLLEAIPVDLIVGDPDLVAPLRPDIPVVLTGEPFFELASRHPHFEPVAVDDDDPCEIFFTSGSSGLPKAVEFTIGSVEHAVRSPTTLAFRPGSRLQIVAPMFHSAGWMWCNYALRGGLTAIIVSSASPEKMISAVADLKASHVQWQPTMLDMVLEALAAAPRDLSSLEMIAYGAAPISPEMLQRVQKHFTCRLTQVYGLTESVCGIGHLPPSAHLRDWGESGPPSVVPNPGNRIRIVGEDGNLLPPGEIGQIHVRLDYPAPHYLAGSVRREIVRPDGWLDTQDLGWRDAEGFLWVVGRRGDMIITGGENVYPSEVENVIAQFEDVAEVAVFGRPDARWGQAIAAAVVPRGGARLTERSIIDRCRDRMAHYKAPRSVIVLEALPRNAGGKVLRPALIQLAAAASTQED